MTNTVMLVGRLSSNPEPEYVTLAVPRAFKNTDGKYETDIIKCKIFGGISQKIMDYCEKGDLIGIKGRLQMNEELEVVAEKVTFLSSKKIEGEN